MVRQGRSGGLIWLLLRSSLLLGLFRQLLSRWVCGRWSLGCVVVVVVGSLGLKGKSALAMGNGQWTVLMEAERGGQLFRSETWHPPIGHIVSWSHGKLTESRYVLPSV